MSILLISIAMEEIGLAHIINAEGEKIQNVALDKGAKIGELLAVNDSVERTLRTVVKSQILTEFKLQEVLEALECVKKSRNYDK